MVAAVMLWLCLVATKIQLVSGVLKTLFWKLVILSFCTFVPLIITLLSH